MSGRLPDGLDRKTSVDAPHREHGVWLRRGFILLITVFLAAGLLNVFGQATSTSEGSSPSADLRVISPSALRGGLLYQAEFQVTAKQALQNPSLVLSSGWFSGLTSNAEVPQPSQQQSGRSQTVFSLGSMNPGDIRTVRIYFQVNPTTVAWDRPQDTEVTDGGAELVAVHRTITVYP
jgi:hypothetical protein